MNFYEKLQHIWNVSNSLVCVGLDPSLEKIPEHLQDEEFPLFEFNRAIIDATAEAVCAYKPQFAYYAASGHLKDLKLTLDYIRHHYPEIVSILDVKRGDIGSTADMYAREAFVHYRADSLTVNPYMGGDTLESFLNYKNKGTIILCRTSNPGSGDFQNLVIDPKSGETLYERVARQAAEKWNGNQNIALVVGATWPEELGKIRSLTGDMPLLVPGIGAQGADIEAAVTQGVNEHGNGMIINSSRGIIYAGEGENFTKMAREATFELREAINAYR